MEQNEVEYNPDDYIQIVEQIKEENNIIFGVYEEDDGRISFRSAVSDPVMLARLLTGITAQVLESQIGEHFRDQ